MDEERPQENEAWPPEPLTLNSVNPKRVGSKASGIVSIVLIPLMFVIDLLLDRTHDVYVRETLSILIIALPFINLYLGIKARNVMGVVGLILSVPFILIYCYAALWEFGHYLTHR